MNQQLETELDTLKIKLVDLNRRIIYGGDPYDLDELNRTELKIKEIESKLNKY